MTVIAPAILADSADHYRTQVERLYGVAERVHIDISDGEFAPTFTVSPAQVWWSSEWKADIHAMVQRPSEHLETLTSMKPQMIIFHAETSENIVPVLEYVKKLGIKAGLALLKTTVPITVKDAIMAADHVMIFSGELGRYGGSASMIQLEKVRLVRMIKPDVEIGWDGGASVDNVYTLAHGGVDVINVGGALANAVNPKETYDQMVNEVNKQGVF